MKSPIRRRIAATVTAVALISLSACGASQESQSATTTAAAVATAQEAARGSSNYVTDLADTHADADDTEYDADGATTIALADGGTEVDGEDAAVDGDVVTISEPGTYLVSGTLSDGQLVVDSAADGKVRIVLDGADITSSTTSPLLITEADEAVLVLADGSANTVSDSKASGEDDEEDDAPNATVYSMADLTIAGTGSLEVSGVSADGITSKDGLVILAGDLTVDAADDGIRGKDYLVLEDGTIDVTAAGDALKADNDAEGELGSLLIDGGALTVDAGDDAVKAEGAMTVNGGTVEVTASVEGLEAADLQINDGTIDVTASDDGINVAGPDAVVDAITEAEGDTDREMPSPPADGQMPEMPEGGEMPSPPTDGEMPEMPTDGELPEGGPDGGMGGGRGGGTETDTGGVLAINGGSVTVQAGGDGVDSNGALVISGGTVTVAGVGNGPDGALDANGDFVVDGGELYAGGGAQMLIGPDEASAQAWLVATLDDTVAGGTTISVVDADGTEVASYRTVAEAGALTVSIPELVDGQSYTLEVAGEQVGTASAGEFSGGGFGGPPQG